MSLGIKVLVLWERTVHLYVYHSCHIQAIELPASPRPSATSENANITYFNDKLVLDETENISSQRAKMNFMIDLLGIEKYCFVDSKSLHFHVHLRALCLRLL